MRVAADTSLAQDRKVKHQASKDNCKTKPTIETGEDQSSSERFAGPLADGVSDHIRKSFV